MNDLALDWFGVAKQSPTLASVHVPVPVECDEDEEECGLLDEFNKFNLCHDPNNGRFCSASGGAGLVRATKQRVFTGEPVELKNKPSKLEVGTIGEQVATAWLHSQGKTDARTLNVNVNNFPVDLVQDHKAYEVKAGLVSNGKTAQHWRATIGQPGKAESAWLKKASPEAKRSWNERKQREIIKRKQKAIAKLSTKSGKPVKGGTIAVILNPDTRKADIYKFDGFHSRIAWNSPQAQAGYVGTFTYGN